MDDADRIELAVGTRPTVLEPVAGHGAPSHRRWRVLFGDRSPAFAKVAAFDYVADWLRLEHANYRSLTGMPYLPDVVGWHDDGEAPVLVIEDLSQAVWPPPWSSQAVDAVLEALAEIQSTPPPPAIDEDFGALFDIHEGWDPMRDDPTGALHSGYSIGRGSSVTQTTSPRPRPQQSSAATCCCTATSEATISVSEPAARS
jgi:hypothetical protein